MEHTISVGRTSYLWRTDPDEKIEKFRAAENHDLTHPTTNFLLAQLDYYHFFHLLTLQDLLGWNHRYFEYSGNTSLKTLAKTTFVHGELLADAKTLLAKNSTFSSGRDSPQRVVNSNYYYYYYCWQISWQDLIGKKINLLISIDS